MANTKKDKTWNDEDLRIAKSLYMDFMSLTEIAKETGVPRTTITYHAQKHWRTERALIADEQMKEWADANRPEMSKITRTSVKIMDRALTSLSKRREPPTMKEAIDAAKVFETMDKIARLDKEEKTGMLDSERPESAEELMKRLREVDPFHVEKESKDDKKSIN